MCEVLCLSLYPQEPGSAPPRALGRCGHANLMAALCLELVLLGPRLGCPLSKFSLGVFSLPACRNGHRAWDEPYSSSGPGLEILQVIFHSHPVGWCHSGPAQSVAGKGAQMCAGRRATQTEMHSDTYGACCTLMTMLNSHNYPMM